MPIRFDELKKRILQMLEDRLDPALTYHHAGHTLDVLTEAERIALSEGVSSMHDLLLLKIAALFHDTGFLYKYREHETRSCEIAREELKNEALTAEDLDRICGMIMATRVPQTPHNHLEQIICDADLDYLGRNDFDAISNSLMYEMLHFGFIRDTAEWDEKQIAFLEAHAYFTGTSKGNRTKPKQEHLLELKTRAGIITK